MDEKNKEMVKNKILELINQSEKELLQLENNTKPISPEKSIGRLSRMDAINNKSVLEAALRNKKKKLSKLKIALTKVGYENFGRCSRCGKEIKIQRLIYIPESDRCVLCADR